MSKRVQASCSPELQCFLRVFGTFTRNDLEVANAMVRRDYDLVRAANFLDTRPDAFRQRLQTLVKKIKQVLPDYTIPTGPVAKEISADQYGLTWAVEGAEADEEAVESNARE